MTSITTSKVPHDTPVVESPTARVDRKASFCGLPNAMNLLSDLRLLLEYVYSRQRDLARQQQTVEQYKSTVRAAEVFDERQKSAAETMRADQLRAGIGIASGCLNFVGAGISATPELRIAGNAGIAAAVLKEGSRPIGAAAGSVIEGIAGFPAASIQRDATTSRNTAERKQVAVNSSAKLADESMAAAREASAKLAENMRSINDLLSGFLSNAQLR